MQLTVASYNIRKAIGTDRRRDPERILAILSELDADIVALQEADRRFGRRASALPLAMLREHTRYRHVPLAGKPDSIGWHGNALLVRDHIEVDAASAIRLPALEPRGAVRADLLVGGRRVRVAGMHLDLSGLRRRRQIRRVLAHVDDCGDDCPAVLMGDFNQWGKQTGAMREFGSEWLFPQSGRSFPSNRPVATLDRIVVSRDWRVLDAGVHRSALSAKGSDHLPVWAVLELHKNQAPCL